jgi:hypothetical protein
MTYVCLHNGKLRGPDGVSFPYGETNPRFADFLTWLQAGGTLVLVNEPPEPEVPAEIQMWQARAILSRVGLLNNVNQAVATIDNLFIEGAKIR